MKTLKIAKYQMRDLLVAVKIFYLIILAVLTSLAVLNIKSNANFNSSGIDFATVIFLFVAGLNSFKSSFKFSQANNISRKTYFKGSILGALPVIAGMSVTDIIINRLYNIFVTSPTNFDMIYRSYGGINGQAPGGAWTQSNDFQTILGTVVFQFALYCMVFTLGVMITTIYYRSNTIMKIAVSVSPVLLLISLPRLLPLFPRALLKAVLDILAFAFDNSYSTSVTFIIMGIFFEAIAFLLMRRAVAKD